MYLLELLSRYTKALLSATVIPLSVGIWIWTFDFHNLSPKTASGIELLQISRMELTLILGIIFLASSIVILLHDHGKTKLKHEAEIKELTEAHSELEKRLDKKPEYAPGVKLKSHNSDLDKVRPRLTNGPV